MMQIARLDSESSFFSFFKYCILLFIPMCMSLKMNVVSAPLPKICQFFLVITIAYVNQLFPHCFALDYIIFNEEIYRETFHCVLHVLVLNNPQKNL